MATINTSSIYIEQIGISYPVAGTDNSSQGFRDNFRNIKLALSSIQQDASDLKGGIFNTEQITIGTNTYSTGTNIHDMFATIVATDASVGNVALLPNQITVNITAATVADVLGNTTATIFPVTSTKGIFPGATFTFLNQDVIFTVSSVTSSTVTTTPAFEVASPVPNQSVTFTNPPFADQPVVATMSSTVPSSTSAIKNDLKGAISANSTALFVNFNDFLPGTFNKFMVSADTVARLLPTGTTANTVTTATDSSTLLATTEFTQSAILAGNTVVRLLPTGTTVPTVTPTTDASALIANTAFVQGAIAEKIFAANGQPALGFTPVQQGTGTGQVGSTVKIGWSSAGTLRVMVDATDFGNSWPISVTGNAATATVAATLPNVLSWNVTGSGGYDLPAGGMWTGIWIAGNDNFQSYTVAGGTNVGAGYGNSMGMAIKIS